MPSPIVDSLSEQRGYSTSSGVWLKEHLPHVATMEVDHGDLHWWWQADLRAEMLDAVSHHFTGRPSSPDVDRVLATVLFTDLVSSTERAAAIGDKRWREILDEHDALIGRELDAHRGSLVKTTGDGIVATFDAPARAIRCAEAIEKQVDSLGLRMRAGIHTGEIERRENDIAGLAVHFAARIVALANAGEILVSRTVRDLVVGSSLRFSERGEYDVKGVPASWQLFAAHS